MYRGRFFFILILLSTLPYDMVLSSYYPSIGKHNSSISTFSRQLSFQEGQLPLPSRNTFPQASGNHNSSPPVIPRSSLPRAENYINKTQTSHSSISMNTVKDSSTLSRCEICGNEWDKSPILILSIDGAAIRGIAQFELLQAIEEQVSLAMMQRQQANYTLQSQRNPRLTTGRNFPITRETITDIFDFFAGTSAGSINVGAILIPENYSLANIPDNPPVKPRLTLQELKERLPETMNAAFATSTFRKVRTLGGLMGSKFSAKPSEAMLQEYAGRTRMSDLVKPAILTSYDLRHREIMNFSTYEACKLKEDPEEVTYLQRPDENGFVWKDKNVFLWQAIRASCSAPVFYKPLELYINGQPRALIDAGLFVMSPTLLAWTEVQKLYPNRRYIFISISSGTINEVRKVRTTGATAGSIPALLKPTIETALEGQQALTDLMMKDLPNITYHRLTFDVVNKDFDDQSEKNIYMLIEAAHRTIASADFKSAIKDIVNARLERKQLNDLPHFICAEKARQINLTNKMRSTRQLINQRELRGKEQLFTPEQAEEWRNQETHFNNRYRVNYRERN